MRTIESWVSGTQLTLAYAALAVALAGLTHVALRWWLRKKVRTDEATAAMTQTGVARARWWVSRSLRDCASPLALLIWIQGLYVVLALLLGRVQAGTVADLSAVALAWGYALSLTGALLWLMVRAGVIVEALLLSVSRGADNAWDSAMLPLLGKAARRLLPVFALAIGISVLSLSPELEQALRKATIVVVIGVVAWILLQVVEAAAVFLRRRHRTDVRDNLQARAIHTQVIVFKKVVNTVIVIFMLASALMVFDSARQFGASILASAGIAGIVVGLAAQRSIATLLAGFQIALTQPIRVDDVVIVENEWGQVEDITLTYVVVRIWDRRRLVVPITYFIEQPFQNWTRSSAEILGTVFLHVDYTVPVEALRTELTRILAASSYWDGKVNVLQVTDVKEHTLQIRALASASDASRAWDLRCEIRERLVEFLQRQCPGCLPRLRASFGAEDFAATPGGVIEQ